jgi:hypothetical protein
MSPTTAIDDGSATTGGAVTAFAGDVNPTIDTKATTATPLITCNRFVMPEDSNGAQINRPGRSIRAVESPPNVAFAVGEPS